MNLPDVVRGLEDVLSGKVALDYVAGAQMGMQIRKAGMEIDAAALVQGLSDIMENKVPKLQPAETQALMQQIQAELMKKAEEKRQADLKQALVDAEAYLEKNAAAPGVTRTPSGLQHAIEKPGEGRTPEDMDIITVNIRGTLADGTEFEKNNEGVPVRKSMRAVCQGLQEGLKLLKPGGKARFVIPPALGFGEAGRPPVVKGNAVLIYEVELINAEPRPPQAAADPNAPKKEPITAVTPPVAVEIPAQPGAAPAAPPVPAPAPGSPPPQKP
jgi:FKBP-type peptidyl-prolyl cis-trans isomerase FkpA